LIIYNVTEADEAVFSCSVETNIKEWTDKIEVQVVGKSMKYMLVFELLYHVDVGPGLIKLKYWLLVSGTPEII